MKASGFPTVRSRPRAVDCEHWYCSTPTTAGLTGRTLGAPESGRRYTPDADAALAGRRFIIGVSELPGGSMYFRVCATRRVTLLAKDQPQQIRIDRPTDFDTDTAAGTHRNSRQCGFSRSRH